MHVEINIFWWKLSKNPDMLGTKYSRMDQVKFLEDSI